jgi:hypothetical protein
LAEKAKTHKEFQCQMMMMMMIFLALGMYLWVVLMNKEMNLTEVEIFLDQQSDHWLRIMWRNGKLKPRLSHCCGFQTTLLRLPDHTQLDI